MLPQVHELFGTVLYDTKPFGLLLPSPVTKAAPSWAANTRSTSCASHSSMLTALSSSRFVVAAGIAYSSIAGNDSSSSVGVVVCARASVSPTQPATAPVAIIGFL